MGSRTLRKSGVTGSSVTGCSTGCGATGMSALMLYQAVGSLVLIKLKLVSVAHEVLLRSCYASICLCRGYRRAEI